MFNFNAGDAKKKNYNSNLFFSNQIRIFDENCTKCRLRHFTNSNQIDFGMIFELEFICSQFPTEIQFIIWILLLTLQLLTSHSTTHQIQIFKILKCKNNTQEILTNQLSFNRIFQTQIVQMNSQFYPTKQTYSTKRKKRKLKFDWFWIHNWKLELCTLFCFCVISTKLSPSNCMMSLNIFIFSLTFQFSFKYYLSTG